MFFRFYNATRAEVSDFARLVKDRHPGKCGRHRIKLATRTCNILLPPDTIVLELQIDKLGYSDVEGDDVLQDEYMRLAAPKGGGEFTVVKPGDPAWSV